MRNEHQATTLAKVDCAFDLFCSLRLFLWCLVAKVPYHRVVACELLKLANRKPTCHFRTLKHITAGKKVVNVKLRRYVSRTVFHGRSGNNDVMSTSEEVRGINTRMRRSATPVLVFGASPCNPVVYLDPFNSN